MNLFDVFECEIQMWGVTEDLRFTRGGTAEKKVRVVKKREGVGKRWEKKKKLGVE
jgi:hypothetical protein